MIRTRPMIRTALAATLLALLACRPSTPPSDSKHGSSTEDRPSATVQPAETQRMAKRLAALADQAHPRQNPFLNDRLADLLLADPTPEKVGRRAELELSRAKELLRAGRSEEAIERYRSLLELVEDPQHQILPAFRRGVRQGLAISYLRAAEQQNCLDGHSPEACLLPIAEGGRHHQRKYAQLAFEAYGSLLDAEPADLESLWLYNLAAMTLGLYPDDLADERRIAPEVFESEANIGRFVNRAHHAGLATVGRAGGVVLDDLDGDGRLDVLFSSWGLTDPLRFFHNLGNGQFEERTTEAGLEGLTGGLNLVQGDYNNDGRLDVLVLRGAWLTSEGRHPDSLLRNLGGGRFEDVTESAGLLAFHPGQTAAWADFDLDGFLDLFIGHETAGPERHRSRLMRNRGDGTFEDVSRALGVVVEGFVKGVTWGDVDNDGRPDLFISRLGEPNLLLRNRMGRASQGPGATFEDITASAGVAEPIFSFPTWFFDYDNDGRLDLFVAGYAESFLETSSAPTAADFLQRHGERVSTEQIALGSRGRLYRNRGDGTFEDVSRAAGVNRVALTMGCNFGDLDNDGWLDFYLGTGAPGFRTQVPNLMFRNDQGRRFQDVTTSGGFGHLQKGHGIAFGDLDLDGDQDVVAVMGGAYTGDVFANALFENPGHEARWLILRLEGTSANRAAIGARVRVHLRTADGDRILHRVVSSGGSFGASSLQVELGLGQALSIDAIHVDWPGGETQVFENLPLDRIVILRQADPSFRVWQESGEMNP